VPCSSAHGLVWFFFFWLLSLSVRSLPFHVARCACPPRPCSLPQPGSEAVTDPKSGCHQQSNQSIKSINQINQKSFTCAPHDKPNLWSLLCPIHMQVCHCSPYCTPFYGSRGCPFLGELCQYLSCSDVPMATLTKRFVYIAITSNRWDFLGT
jgi:hypothetical protein